MLHIATVSINPMPGRAWQFLNEEGEVSICSTEEVMEQIAAILDAAAGPINLSFSVEIPAGWEQCVEMGYSWAG